MIGLYISLALLGLSAIDPVGIAIMPLLLAQKRPYRRALVFLFGSFVSLMLAGIVFAKGLGQVALRLEQSHTWLVPSVKIGAGIVLLAIAGGAYVQLKTGKATAEPSARTRTWLELGDWQLFSAGALLVAAQSIVDVVFVVAMVHIGQLQPSDVVLVSTVATYAITALLIQLAVVVMFKLTPLRDRTALLVRVRKLLARYAAQSVVAVSLVLGLVLIVLGLLG